MKFNLLHRLFGAILVLMEDSVETYPYMTQLDRLCYDKLLPLFEGKDIVVIDKAAVVQALSIFQGKITRTMCVQLTKHLLLVPNC